MDSPKILTSVTCGMNRMHSCIQGDNWEIGVALLCKSYIPSSVISFTCFTCERLKHGYCETEFFSRSTIKSLHKIQDHAFKFKGPSWYRTSVLYVCITRFDQDFIKK